MLSPVALAAGDFLTWRIRLPDSGSSSPPCEKGEKRMEQYTTQMDAARRGIVTKELEIVAKKERMTVEELMPLVAEGKVAICANKHHTFRINVTHEDQCQSRCIERLQGL